MSKPVTRGSIIKAYDFHGDEGCFRVGEVHSMDEDFLYCATISRTFEGVECEFKTPTFRTPKQGLLMRDEIFERIVVVG